MSAAAAAPMASLQMQLAAISIETQQERLLRLLQAEKEGRCYSKVPAVQKVVAEFFAFEPADIPQLMRHVTNRPSQDPKVREKMEALSLRLQQCARNHSLFVPVKTIAEALHMPQVTGAVPAASIPIPCLQLISEYAEEPMGANKAFCMPFTWRIKALCLALEERPTDADKQALDAAFEIFTDLLKESPASEFLHHFDAVLAFKKREGIFGREMDRFLVQFCNGHLEEKLMLVVADILQSPDAFSALQRSIFLENLDELIQIYSEAEENEFTPSAGFGEQLLDYYVALYELQEGAARVVLYMDVMYKAQADSRFGEAMEQLQNRLQGTIEPRFLVGLKPWIAHTPEYARLSVEDKAKLDPLLDLSYAELEQLVQASQKNAVPGLCDALIWQIMALQYMDVSAYQGANSEERKQRKCEHKKTVELLRSYLSVVPVVESIDCIQRLIGCSYIPTDFGTCCRMFLDSVAYDTIPACLDNLNDLQGETEEVREATARGLMDLCLYKLDQCSYEGIAVQFDAAPDSPEDLARALLMDCIDPLVKKFEAVFATDHFVSTVYTKAKDDNKFMKINYKFLYDRLKKLVAKRAPVVTQQPPVQGSDDSKV